MCAFVYSTVLVKNCTGLALIDKHLGNIEDGTLLLIKEDINSYMHTYILNTFISECVYKKCRNIVVINKENKFENRQTNIYRRKGQTSNTTLNQKMHIAWRYKDSSILIDEYKYSLTSKITDNNVEIIENINFSDLLEKFKCAQKCIFIIYSLFSPSYEKINVERFLYNLRKYCRINKHICFMSIPTGFYPNVQFNQFFDIILSLDSDLWSNYLPNYRALLHLEKNVPYNRLNIKSFATYKFGMKFSKDQLVVEHIDIPPDNIEESVNCLNF